MNLDAIITALAVGAITGGVSALATIAVLRTHIDHLRETVDRHENWIHSLAGELSDLRK